MKRVARAFTERKDVRFAVLQGTNGFFRIEEERFYPSTGIDEYDVDYWGGGPSHGLFETREDVSSFFDNVVPAVTRVVWDETKNG